MAGRNRKRIVFIIPGFRHTPQNKGYRTLRRLLSRQGYKTIPVAIPWRKTTILDNVKHFLDEYKRSLVKLDATRKEVYFLGFSYGAIIAFLAATKLPVTGLILCSLSPFFKEDLSALPVKVSDLAKKRHESFAMLSSTTLAKKVKTRRVVMLYGAKESKMLINRSFSAFTHMATNSKFLFRIQKTDHNISDSRYTRAISFLTQTLLPL